MKKLVFLAFVAMLFVACGYKSVETPIGENYVKFTEKVNEQIFVGVRNVNTSAVLIEPTSGFSDIQLKHDLFFIAHKNGKWSIFNLNGKPCFKDAFASISIGQNAKYLIPKKEDGSCYYLSDNCFFGPYVNIDLRTADQFAFVNDGSSYAMLSLESGQALIPGTWKQIVIAHDAKGKVGYYVTDSQGMRLLDLQAQNEKVKVKYLKSWVIKSLQNEAKDNNTPWPADGQCGIVKVKTLR